MITRNRFEATNMMNILKLINAYESENSITKKTTITTKTSSSSSTKKVSIQIYTDKSPQAVIYRNTKLVSSVKATTKTSAITSTKPRTNTTTSRVSISRKTASSKITVKISNN